MYKQKSNNGRKIHFTVSCLTLFFISGLSFCPSSSVPQKVKKKHVLLELGTKIMRKRLIKLICF